MKRFNLRFCWLILVVLFLVLFFCLIFLPVIRRQAGSGKTPLLTRIIAKLAGRQPAPTLLLKAEKTVIIPEGQTVLDIAETLSAAGFWPSSQFLDVVGWPRLDYRHNKNHPDLPDFFREFSFLADKPSYYGLEGYLFPDTYRFYASSMPVEVVEKMLANFDRKLTPPMRADIKAQGKTIYEIVTLASLVEKEAPIDYATGDNRDARLIAGIFWNRLAIGQALQSDATLSYVLGDNKIQHSGADLTFDSPYNTYKYSGLPPGPICNPGLLALEAAVYPLVSDYNYFLTADGQVIYAKTYAEQMLNKQKYLK